MKLRAVAQADLASPERISLQNSQVNPATPEQSVEGRRKIEEWGKA